MCLVRSYDNRAKRQVSGDATPALRSKGWRYCVKMGWRLWWKWTEVHEFWAGINIYARIKSIHTVRSGSIKFILFINIPDWFIPA
jgi:hypothetical protein